jgi:CTP:molybdopterin cytidylyltransferase MocA
LVGNSDELSGKAGRVAAVMLAAGMSRRMGTPKQLLRIERETILERTLKNVLACLAKPKIRIVPANSAQSLFIEGAIVYPQVENRHPLTFFANASAVVTALSNYIGNH